MQVALAKLIKPRAQSIEPSVQCVYGFTPAAKRRTNERIPSEVEGRKSWDSLL